MIKKIFILLSCVFMSFAYAQESAVRHDLLSIVRNLGASLSYDMLSERGMISKNGHNIQFALNDSILLFDYDTFEIIEEPELIDDKIYFSSFAVDKIENFLLPDNTMGAFYEIGAIVIDAGHGGKDPGAEASFNDGKKDIFVTEKEISLDVANMLFKKLKKKYPNKSILMTRTKDEYLSLEERVSKANELKVKDYEAVLYVSVHVNASPSSNASGFEVWYLPPECSRALVSSEDVDSDVGSILNVMLEEEFTTESMLMAQYISDGMDSKIGKESKNRGLKENEWYVVKNTKMPSVLIEIGFLTNEKEAMLLSSNRYLTSVADGIYQGLVDFVTQFEESKGFTEVK